MATSPISEVIRHLRRAVLLRDGPAVSDGQLLENYLSRRDGARGDSILVLKTAVFLVAGSR